jgi:anhydro-N-acetylmuramic acid kinase
MSGTSLDGIDAALVRIRPAGDTYRVDLLNFQTVPFEPKLAAALRAALPPAAGSVRDVAQLHHELGLAFAAAVESVESDMPIDYVASHGQTLWHDGPAHVTLQAGDPFVIRERCKATVCYDFRSGDCAAGGHGAPLVPFVDAILLRSDAEDRVAVNLGGIANLTVLPRGCGVSDAIAFDSGPGMMLIDAAVARHSGGALHYDAGGSLALRGRVHESALESLLADPYFALPPPKTTGRERFGEQFLHAHARALQALSLEDAAATLAALTAETVAGAIRSVSREGARVIVSGGGSRNEAVMAGLRERLGAFRVERSDVMNLHPDAKEAIAFAVLGYETLRGRAANVPRATGAGAPAMLGAIAPYRLLSLLSKVESECRTSS